MQVPHMRFRGHPLLAQPQLNTDMLAGRPSQGVTQLCALSIRIQAHFFTTRMGGVTIRLVSAILYRDSRHHLPFLASQRGLAGQ